MGLNSILRISVITPSTQKTWDAAWVNLPGQKGRRGLFPEAAPEILLLQEGVVTYQNPETSHVQEYAISGGVGHIYTHLDGHTWCDILAEEPLK